MEHVNESQKENANGTPVIESIPGFRSASSLPESKCQDDQSAVSRNVNKLVNYKQACRRVEALKALLLCVWKLNSRITTSEKSVPKLRGKDKEKVVLKKREQIFM